MKLNNIITNARFNQINLDAIVGIVISNLYCIRKRFFLGDLPMRPVSPAGGGIKGGGWKRILY